MLKAGVTGGIGSGKSIVCEVFHTLGIPVFNADNAARLLMETDPALIAAITGLLGEVYSGGRLDRDKVSAILFSEPEKLNALNALVHPATIAYGNAWLKSQSSPYVIKEAALFFESGSYTEMDVMIGVAAPRELRIARAMARSSMTRDKVISIMNRQMDDDEKIKRCDYVIVNDDVSAILPQVLHLHSVLLSKAKI